MIRFPFQSVGPRRGQEGIGEMTGVHLRQHPW